MNELDLWRIADTLALTHAAALICGEEPSKVRAPNEFTFNHWHIPPIGGSSGGEFNDDAPENFSTALHALIRAAERGTLKAEKRYLGKYQHIRYVGEESEGYWEPVSTLDPSETTVDVEDLRTWLGSRGVKSGFFFPKADDLPEDLPGYLDPGHPRYAVKLGAAIWAWEATADPGTRHPKQAIEKWLREHAADFGLTDDDGKPNETGIAEVPKVANWKPTGGAPKTPRK